MTICKRLFPFFISLVYITFSLPAFAQDSLEVNILSRYFNNFDTMQKIFSYGFYYDIVVNQTDLNISTNGNNGDLAEYLTIETSDTIHTACRYSNTHYLANDDEGLSIFQYLNNFYSYPQYGKCFDVVALENTAFIATNSGFYVLNTEEAENPVLLSSYVDSNGFIKIILDNIYAYVVDDNQTLHVINIDNYNLIRQVGSIYLGTDVNSLSINNNSLFALSENDGIFVYSLENPIAPTLVNHPEFPEQAYNMSVRNDTALVSCGDDGIAILDISDEENFIELGSYRINSKWVVLDNFWFYSITGEEFCSVLNCRDFDNIFFQSFYGTNHIVDYAHEGYLAYACDDICGLMAMDVSYPWYISSWRPFELYPCRRVALNEDHGAFITTNNEVKLFDSEMPGYSGILSTIVLDAKGTDLDISSDILTISLENGGFRIYDISTDTEPLFLSEMSDHINANGINVDDGILCLAGANGNLSIYDISNPTQTPVLYSSLPIANTCKEVLIYQSFAFVACGEDGVKIVDIYDPENPTLVSTIDTDGIAYDVTIGGWYFYIADGLNGVRVYDIHSPYQPELVGYYDTPGNALRVFAWHENCGVADENEFLILRYAYATDTPGDDSPLPTDFRIESVYPNPFNPNCNVKINIPESGLMSLKVFNTLGQEVSSLSKTRVKAGNFDYCFFGENFASGTYFLQVELVGHGIQTKKMVLLK